MPEIKNILYATDLADSAPYAFSYAMKIAKSFDANMTVVHVVESLARMEKTTIFRYLGKEALGTIDKTKEEEALKEMGDRVQISFCQEENKPAKDDQVSFQVYKGQPADEILKHSKEYDLIIMGNHEKGITHNFLGSVTKRVLKKSSTPVFVIPLSMELEK